MKAFYKGDLLEINPVRNSSEASNPAGTIAEPKVLQSSGALFLTG